MVPMDDGVRIAATITCPSMDGADHAPGAVPRRDGDDALQPHQASRASCQGTTGSSREGGATLILVHPFADGYRRRSWTLQPLVVSACASRNQADFIHERATSVSGQPAAGNAIKLRTHDKSGAAHRPPLRPAGLCSFCMRRRDDAASSSRCDQAESSAAEKRDAYLSAAAEADQAEGDYREARAELARIQQEVAQSGVSQMQEAGDASRRSMAAEGRQAEATSIARTNGRLFAQIVIGESECFTPDQVAGAREILSATD
jgi:hypothetical protein